MLQAGGSDPIRGRAQAKALLGKTMSQQAYIQAYNDVFYIMGALLLIAVFAVLLIENRLGLWPTMPWLSNNVFRYPVVAIDFPRSHWFTQQFCALVLAD